MVQLDKQAVMRKIKTMAFEFPLERMANEVNKPYSTLSNELAERDYAKLGLRTFLSMLEAAFSASAPEISKMAGLQVLDMIEAAFGRVAYNIPRQTKNPTDLMRLISTLSIEYAQDIENLAVAMDDGKWTKEEIARCRKENRDLLRSCLKIEAFLDRAADAPAAGEGEA
jgi:hypothetical protein